jgi:hypothetical protein
MKPENLRRHIRKLAGSKGGNTCCQDDRSASKSKGKKGTSSATEA